MFFSGTQHYCPPEFYSDHCFLGSQATVWQLGFLLAEMVAGEMPYVKPRMALYMRPSIPNHLSAGEKILPWLSVVEGLACSRFSVSGMIEKAGTSRDKGDPVVARSRFPAIVPTDREPGTGYVVLASKLRCCHGQLFSSLTNNAISRAFLLLTSKADKLLLRREPVSFESWKVIVYSSDYFFLLFHARAENIVHF